MDKFLQTLVSGIAVGGIYAIAALGFVLVFKATRVINFAQGAMMLLGGYVAYAFSVSMGLPLAVAVVAATATIAAGGGGMYLVSLGPVTRRPGNTEFAQVIMTMAWSIIFISVVQLIWGAVGKTFPSFFPAGTIKLGGVRIAYEDLGTIGITIVVVLVFALVFRFTKLGLLMRGLADNAQAAVAMGANQRAVNIAAWALAGAAAAIAGITLTSYVPLGLTFGDVALMAFPAVVLGGIDSIPGGLLGGALIGIVQQMAAAYIDPGFGLVAGFLVMLVVLLVRPTGLLGSREVVRL
jgi:branched-chain amino acid transport system permease protein